MKGFDSLPVRPGRFYLPDEKDIPLWPIVACDQYSAQKDVWQQAYDAVGDAPSALKLIIPEAYLDESDTRVPAACAQMKQYLADGTLKEAVNGFVLVERATQSGVKTGLVVTVDLEDYSFLPGTKSAIRPTEGTIVERIPPRLKVRQDADLELPHILLLIDDPQDTVIGPIYAARDTLRPVYDTDLLLNGGHIRGWAVEDEARLSGVANALSALRARLNDGGILIAVGDGNHSLATAKAHWENVKATLTEEEQKTHPARFAGAEINNIYSPALIFEPIHRVIFDTDEAAVMAMLQDAGLEKTEGPADVTIVTRDHTAAYRITRPLHTLPIGTVQILLNRVKPKLDYVHGEDAVREIVKKENAVGILVPAMEKSLLFPAVEKNGPLPRKTFSMGEANEKRYYMEAGKIR